MLARCNRAMDRGSYSTDLVVTALLGCGSLFAFVLWHVIAATRAHINATLLAFRVRCFHTQRKFVHAAVVFFVFSKSESQTVARGEIADDLRESAAVIAGAIHV